MENCIRLLNLKDGPFMLDESLKSKELDIWRKQYAYPYFPETIR